MTAPLEPIERIRQALAAGPTPGEWMLATSNSWRRFVTTDGRSVCEPIVYSERDRHPDLYFKNGGSDGPDAKWIAACSPDAIRSLLSRLDELEKDAARWRFARQFLLEATHINGPHEGKIAFVGDSEGLDEIVDSAIAKGA